MVAPKSKPARTSSSAQHAPRQTKANVTKKVKKLTGEHFGTDIVVICEKTKFTDHLGADSLSELEFVMLVEDEFKVEISDEDAEKCKTVGDVIKLIQGLVCDN